VDVVGAFEVKKLEALIKEKANGEHLAVIIVRTPCRLIETKRSAVPAAHTDKCVKCYLCIGLDCPALSKTAEGIVKVNHKLCIGCNLCAEICPRGGLEKNA
jgi:indolepyruvate ferredoxin oxidoreductase alpha subunit